MSKNNENFENQAAFDSAVELAATAATSYYDTDAMRMTDAEYDALVERIEAAVTVHPDWDDKGIVTAVAGGASAGGDVKHPVPMLSLSKVKELSDIEKFVATIESDIVVEVKLDGLAIRAEYVNGKLTQAVTRGDGLSGEDITAQAHRFGGIDGLPMKLDTAWTGEVRGEVFMTDENFFTANENRVAAGGKAFVNPRNATAGSLRKADRDYATPMSFGAYDISGEHVDSLSSYIMRMLLADNIGFTTALTLTPMILEPKELDVIGRIQHIEDKRAALGFPIDGAVIKADENADRDRLGMASRTPKWATSYKYAADTSTTVLKDIEVQIGRTGRITLRALLEPVFVGGTTITYATLHHPGFVADQGLAIGQTVAVYRAGDVIPRVTAAMGEQPAGLTQWVPPETCPQCDEAWDKSSVLWRCHTPECSVAGRIEYFASRDAMDIEGLSVSTAEALTESGLVSNVADLFDLTVSQIAAVKVGTTTTGGDRLIGTTVATKLVAEIEKSKNQPLNRVITSLGISKVGRSVGRWLAREYPTMSLLRAATPADIATIEKMGEIKANFVVNGLRSLSDVIDRMAAAGINMGSIPDAVGPQPLAGQSYVISGSIPGFTRTTAQEAVEALGGNASSSVSATTTALITDDTSTSKGQKAIKLGIPVISPADFLEILNG